ncbi:MAG: hypothetical protein UY11_C0015G0013 [Candidatus Amesbacteria bacterium GW2011_GWC2_47_8]|uniref:Methyltransferase domain-containing protein n=1 Tax=Candidatus Amesbacteria bacterium GW2011_GWC2_47_8 TaxID=1618367 RepID=A0A0G1WN98_9BACT|nr:MAG: hypothetical protein UY11_C0015G0013 [Candidatus Amesbacteria bacterium GW2011_GWC2_47_8]
MKYSPGSKEIYSEVIDGLSYYQTTGEVYHTLRSKAKFHKFYLQAITGRAFPKILDIGCPKAKYLGIDVSSKAITIAKSLSRKRGEKNVDFQIVDGNKPLPFSDKSFDIIYALELIEHLKTPAQFFAEVRRVLKDNGVFIVSTPNADTFLNKISRWLPPSLSQALNQARLQDFARHGTSSPITPIVWDRDAHISLWGFSKWRSTLVQSGFKLDCIEGSSFYGGSRYISEKPFLLGLMILLDSVIDLLPFKPHLQMCMLLKLVKAK